MILHEEKLIYIHIPKTGGSSIMEAYTGEHRLANRPSRYVNKKLKFINVNRSLRRKYPNMFITGLHDTYDKIGTRINISEFKIFSSVRNEWERMASAYRYHIKIGKIEEEYGFGKYLKTGWLSIAPIQYFIPVEEWGNVRFLRTSNLKEDYEKMCSDWSVEQKEIKITNSTQNEKSYQEYYTEEWMVEFVRRVHSRSIEYFDFKFS